MLFVAPVGGDVVDAEQPDGAVEGKAHEIVEAVLELALQDIVDADERVGQVGEEVGDAVADLLVQHLAIASRHRPGEVFVEGIVEAVHAAVEGLERVARVALLAGRGAAPEGRQDQEQNEPDHFFSSLPSAALLNRNWLIRFSSTTADCVRRTRSPCLSITPSPPASSPTYCSPRMPEVRILAVVSRGNWYATPSVIDTMAS